MYVCVYMCVCVCVFMQLQSHFRDMRIEKEMDAGCSLFFVFVFNEIVLDRVPLIFPLLFFFLFFFFCSCILVVSYDVIFIGLLQFLFSGFFLVLFCCLNCLTFFYFYLWWCES